jgi:hypothetical protein
MLLRCSLVLAPLVAFSLAAMLGSAGSPLLADEPKPAVSLLLSEASAERREQDALFRCEATLENATGKDLTVRSSFFSVFDGLELVVTTREGKTLAQQPYTFHQSPFAAHEREFTLKKGGTAATLVFPIGELPGNTRGEGSPRGDAAG